jgi:beta-galactosidase
MAQMYGALYELNIETDFVQAGDPDLARYKVLLVPPLYSASDRVLAQVSEYVKNGGHVVMAFKSGFTDEHSTVRATIAPGPLRAAAGFHYQEFTSLVEPLQLTPDPYRAGAENRASVWQEFLISDTAEVIASADDTYWRFPVLTRNRFGKGTLTYEAAVLTDTLQREVIREVINGAGLGGPDQLLPHAVRVRHGTDTRGRKLHYYFNFSGQEQAIAYPYPSGSDLLTGTKLQHGNTLSLRPWDLAIIAEQP